MKKVLITLLAIAITGCSNTRPLVGESLDANQCMALSGDKTIGYQLLVRVSDSATGSDKAENMVPVERSNEPMAVMIMNETGYVSGSSSALDGLDVVRRNIESKYAEHGINVIFNKKEGDVFEYNYTFSFINKMSKLSNKHQKNSGFIESPQISTREGKGVIYPNRVETIELYGDKEPTFLDDSTIDKSRKIKIQLLNCALKSPKDGTLSIKR